MKIGLLASIGRTLDAFFPEIVAEWEQLGHQVFPAAGTEARRMDSTVLRGLDRRPGLPTFKAALEIRKWVRDNSLDVVITNTATASAVVRLSGIAVPVIYFCHGLHWSRIGSIQNFSWGWLEAKLLKNTAGVVTINSDDEHWFLERMDSRRLLRVKAGVGVPIRSYPQTPLPSGDLLRIAWIGEHTARKRPGDALDVANVLRLMGVPFTLRMLGDGPLIETIQRSISQRKLDSFVEVVGYGNSHSELKDAHVLVHTARWEGLPRVALEALSVGRSTYAYDVKGVRDIPDVRSVPDGAAAELAARIAGDWRRGNIRSQFAEGRQTLDQRYVATELAAFACRVVAAT